MENKKKYRHELKYYITSDQIPIIKNRLLAIAKLDSHAGENGIYTIRSLYFDSIANRCYYENEDGVDKREKYRIRIYNGLSDRISLECKRKEHGMTQKKSCLIGKAQCLSLMRGQIPVDIEDNQRILKKLIFLMYTELFKPKVIVEYDRVPYIYSLGNVRITIDANIRSSIEIDRFFETSLPTRPVLQSGQHILEVKYDEFLPDYIKEVLELGVFTQTAFSKYYICRRINTGGKL